MRVVVAGLLALAIWQAGVGPAAAQMNNCVAVVGQFGDGRAGASDALGGACLAGNTLPLGNGIRLPFGFLPRNATVDGSAIMACAIAETEVAAHGYRPLWLAALLPDALVSSPQPTWSAACVAR
jgi:hypothetical protein